MKSVKELISPGDSNWKWLLEEIKNSKNQVEILSATETARTETLCNMQLPTSSTLGSIVYNTGGILIDQGWIRILASGSDRLPRNISIWNSHIQEGNLFELPYHIVADDVVGGFYAMDAGGLGDPGKIFYYAPDALEWENRGVGYTNFIQWLLQLDIDAYYEGLRWKGWEKEVSVLPGDRTFNFLPPLFMKPSSSLGEQADRDRRPVPVDEIYFLYLEDYPRQLGLD